MGCGEREGRIIIDSPCEVVVCLFVCLFVCLLFRKYPELFSMLKTLLGFKEPNLVDQLPSNANSGPYVGKERVNEFAAELGGCGCMVCFFLNLFCLNVSTAHVCVVWVGGREMYTL